MSDSAIIGQTARTVGVEAAKAEWLADPLFAPANEQRGGCCASPTDGRGLFRLALGASQSGAQGTTRRHRRESVR